MKRATKIILITTALLTATTAAIASRGEFCDQRGGMQGMNNSGYMQGQQYMQGKHHFNKNHAKKGMKQAGVMRGVYRLDNLSDVQKDQLFELRQSQRKLMRDQRIAMQAQMKEKVNAILTDDQRTQLEQMRSFN